MSTTIAKPCTQVTLIRPEGGSQTFTSPESSTLTDLLRQAGTAVRTPDLLNEGRPIEEVPVLNSGMSIAIMPEPPQAPAEKARKNRTSTMDLTIAAIVLRHGATLRSAILRDFNRVPDLSVEGCLS